MAKRYLHNLLLKALPLMTVLFAACADDNGLDNEKEKGWKGDMSVAVVQDWDNPETRTATVPDAAENLFQANGSVGGVPVYIYTTEVEGISGVETPVEVETSQVAQTKGVLYSSSNFHDSFHVYSTIVDGDVRTPDGLKWYLSQPIVWDDDAEKTFYAIAPYAAYTGVTAATPILTYTNPDRAKEQTDLMASVTTGKRTDAELVFPFKHILSGIKFKVGAKGLANPHDNTKIKQIELAGILKQGTYNIATHTWALGATTGSAKQADDWEFSLAGKSIGANLMITNDAAGTTFLVVPQTIPSGAKVNITIEENGVEQTISAKLTGEWKQGYTKTYNITSVNEYPGYVLEVEGSPVFDYTGAPVSSQNTFKVTSYKNDASKTAAPWSIDGYANEVSGAWEAYSTTNGTFAKNYSKTSGAGSQSGETVTMSSVAHQTKTVIREDYRRQNEMNKYTRIMEVPGCPRAPKTEVMDLSAYAPDNDTPLAAHSSANCYIVRQAGKYKIPIVIGNTIKDDAKNVYTGYNYSTFVNYKGLPITGSDERWLLRGVKTAEILWQDAKNLVKLTYSDVTGRRETIGGYDIDYLYFEVPEETICQGNAVIVVKDADGAIMWSYHIYVTDTDWTKTVECQGQTTDPVYNFAPEFIGYVEDKYLHLEYHPRKMRLRVTQAVSGLTGDVVVNQTRGETRLINPKATLYQYGRKDAFPGYATSYDASGSEIKLTGQDSKVRNVNMRWQRYTIGSMIQNPLIFPAGQTRYDWNSIYPSWSLRNLWSANYDGYEAYSDDLGQIKTIYDPSPAGFVVPPSNAFLFTTKKAKSNDQWLIMTQTTEPEWNADKAYQFAEISGYYFYTKSTSEANSFYIPAVGRRHAGTSDISGLNANGTFQGGRSWTAHLYHPSGSDHRCACVLNFYSNFVSSRAISHITDKGDYDYLTAGFGILPVAR